MPDDQHDQGGAFTGRSVPPWERPGALRRDREPHRAGLVLALGMAALAAGAAGRL